MWSQTLTIAEAVIRDAIRRKVVWIILIFAALLSFVIPALPSFGVGVASAVFREVAIALMFAASLVVGLALASTRIPAEIEKRTVFSVITRDVSRWQYVVGSWLGMFIVVGVAIIAFSVVAIGVGLVAEHQTMLVLLLAALAVWLEVGVLMAIALLASTRFGPVTAIVLALAVAFIGHSITPTLLGLPPGAALPWWIPTLEVFNVINPVAHGDGYGVLYALSMLGAFIGWCGLVLLAASAAFANRDL